MIVLIIKSEINIRKTINVKMEKFVIRKKTTGEFQFDFIDKEGNIILRSGTYTRKTMCINGIESVKRNSKDNSKFNLKKSPNDEPYFNLKSFNGKILGVSKIFEDKSSRNNSIESLKSKALEAPIEDQST
jgi:uncharacterized protein YegP (UPF0339 family)